MLRKTKNRYKTTCHPELKAKDPLKVQGILRYAQNDIQSGRDSSVVALPQNDMNKNGIIQRVCF